MKAKFKKDYLFAIFEAQFSPKSIIVQIQYMKLFITIVLNQYNIIDSIDFISKHLQQYESIRRNL